MNEGAAAVLAALIAVAGVGLGLFGARWQARGLQQQANAAIEAVRAQGRDQNTQWRRTVRRDVWVDFLGAVDAFRDSAGDVTTLLSPEGDDARAESELAETMYPRVKRVGDAFHKIELEGPEEVIEKAAAVRGIIGSTAFELDQELIALRATRVIEEASRSEMEASDAGEPGPATRALHALMHLHQMATDDGRIHDQAREVGRQLHELNLTTIDDLGHVLIHYSRQENLQQVLENFPVGRWRRFEQARAEFVKAARTHLDGEH